MNVPSRLSDSEITDLLRRRSARPAPDGLASAILESLASERARHPARTAGRSAKRPLMLLAAAALLAGGALAAGSGALRLWSITPPDATTSGGMWPQSTLEEVRAAQERADAGDRDYTWQVEPRLADSNYESTLRQPGQVRLVDRFLREVLGWASYTMWDAGEGLNRDGSYYAFHHQLYLRCAVAGANRLYPDESCAPTLGDFNYEQVSLDLAQLDRRDEDGIWVVSRWGMTAPFAQSDPAPVEAQARERLDAFLAARVAGNGAVGDVRVDGTADVPLLYATTSGAPYERYEIERVDGPNWPYGSTIFAARLFADSDATVVEQRIASYSNTALVLDANSTTENGQPTSLSYTSDDGQVSLSAPSTTWNAWLPGKAGDVWFGGLWKPGGGIGYSEPSIGLVDPVAYDAWCAASGGSPLLSAPADAASIAQRVIADPNFQATAPVAARIGGLDALSIDVALAPGGRACGIEGIEISRWIHELDLHPELRMRLWLVDLPAGMSIKTLAITAKAPYDRFEAYLAEAAPIIQSIQFHAGAVTTGPSQMP